jgi:hypothetical protein
LNRGTHPVQEFDFDPLHKAPTKGEPLHLPT